MVASAGITLGEKTGWFSALRWRYISSRPLTEDGVFQSPPSNIFNGAVGYRFDNGWSIRLDALNLLNSTTDNATYAYGSLLTTDALYAMCQSGTAAARRRRSAPTASWTTSTIRSSRWPFGSRLPARSISIGTLNLAAMAAELGRSIRVQAGPAGELRLDRFLYRRSCRRRLVEDQRQHRQHGDRRRRRRRQQRLAVARRHAARLRLHAAVARRDRARGRRLVRQHQDDHGHRRFGTSANRTTVFDSETATRAPWLRARQCPALRNRRLGVVERSIHPHPDYGHA